MNRTDKKLISLGSLQHGTRGVTKIGGTKAYSGFLVQLGDDGIFDPSVLPPGSTEEEVRKIVDEAIQESEERADGKFAPKFVRIDDSIDSCEEIELAMLAVSNLYAIQEHESNYDNPHAVTKDQVGLDNVDNTSDMDKPISTAVQEALDDLSEKVSTVFRFKGSVDDYSDLPMDGNRPGDVYNVKKDGMNVVWVDGSNDSNDGYWDDLGASLAGYLTEEEAEETYLKIADAIDEYVSKQDFEAHTGNTENPHSVTKSQVGLGNVDNTSDADKPISIATQTALDGKVNVNHTGDVSITGRFTVTGSNKSTIFDGEKIYRQNGSNPGKAYLFPDNGGKLALQSEIPAPVSVVDPATATESDEGKAADAYKTKLALDGKVNVNHTGNVSITGDLSVTAGVSVGKLIVGAAEIDGNVTTAVAEGSSKTYANNSHSEGHDTRIANSATFSHVEGYKSKTGGTYSHAAGYRALTAEGPGSGGSVVVNAHNYAWVWNGDTSIGEQAYYSSHGEGTFNINPKPETGSTDSTTGFWIGNRKLSDILSDVGVEMVDPATATMSDEGKAADAYRTKVFVEGLKPQYIYDFTGVEALDDKGGLHTSVVSDSYYSLGATVFAFIGKGWNAALSKEAYNYQRQGGGTMEFIAYDPSGKVYHTWSDGAWQNEVIGDAPVNADPRNGDVLPSFANVTLHGYSAADLVFTPRGTAINESPYTHFALESVPTRTIEASTKYQVGDLIGDGTKAYRCKLEYTSASTPVAPSSDTTHWDEIPTLSSVSETDPVFTAWKNGASIAAGNGASVTSSTTSVAIGNRATAGQKAIAISSSDNTNTTNASGTQSIAVGFYAKATASEAIAIGKQAQASAAGAAQIGYSSNANDVANSLRFRDTVVVNGNGKIPSANLDKAFVQTVVEKTWSELKALRDDNSGTGSLVPGQWYRITDYVATTVQADTQSANHPFDIIVRADSTNKLNENAYAIKNASDTTYFINSKLETWQVWYCLDNDTNRFAWADTTNGKGVVYRLIDEFGNDCPYDFKGIQFKRWAITNVTSTKISDVSSLVSSFSYSETGKCFAYKGSNISVNGTVLVVDTSTSQWHYTFSDTVSGNAVDISLTASNDVHGNKIGPWYYDNKLKLNGIVFIGSNCYADTFGSDCSYNTFGSNCYADTFGSDCSFNTLGSDCSYNTFGSNCYADTFGSGCSYNTFDSYCSSNTFGSDCSSNTLGSGCSSNTFDSYCSSNTFDSGCSSNTFDSYCSSNTFDSGCSSNTFGSGCYADTFGSGCYADTFGSGCSYNTFDSGCSSNTFDSYCSSNTFDSGCDYNTFGGGCQHNTFGSGCSYNTFGYSPQIFSATTSYAVGDLCWRGGYVYRCTVAHTGSWSSSHFVKDPSAVARAYYLHIAFESGVQYVFLDCTATRTSSEYYQNVTVSKGILGTTSVPKSIQDSNKDQAFKTTYRPANSQEISV